jgi:filamentous hemagglutinin family protein
MSARAGWAASLIGIALGSLAHPAGAQVASEIVRDGSVGPDSSAQPTATRDAQGGVHFEIDESLGERPGSGPNLFHSFSVFDLATGDRAVFTADPALSTERVISRVTGGRPSLLFGTLESRIPGADFYFLNPSGIVFGADAQLHVDGSVIATTASAIQFAGGEVFSSDARSPAPLLSAPGVEAFGFLDRPASIDVAGARLAVPDGETLALVGGDLSFDRAELTATSGRIDLASVGSSGLVRWSDGGLAAPALLGVDSFARLGDVSLRSTRLLAENVSGPAGGALRVRGGMLQLTGGSILSTSGFNGASAGGLDLAVDALILDRSFLTSDGVGGGSAGRIAVRAGEIALAGGSSFSAAGAGGGAGGRVVVDAGSVRLGGGSFLRTTGFDRSDAGEIDLRASSLALDGSSILAESFGGGRAGRLAVDAESVQLTGGSLFRSSGFDGGAVGEIDLRADSLVLGGSSILAEGIGGGRAGRITVRAGEIALEGTSLLSAAAGGGGPGGHVFVDAGSLRLAGGSSVRSSGFDGGASGDIDLRADALVLEGSSILAESFGSGRAGRLAVRAGSVLLGGGSSLGSSGFDGGAAGEIDLRADLLVLDGSFIAANSFLGALAGRIHLTARDLALAGGSSISASASGGGEAGAVSLETGTLRLANRSLVLASGFEGSSAGRIDATAGAVALESGSFLLAEGTRGSSPGLIVVRAGDLAISGASGISVGGFGAEEAGRIEVLARELSLSDRSFLFAGGQQGAAGGSVDVQAERISLSGESSISADGFTGAAAGRVDVRAGSLSISEESFVSADGVGGGVGGRIVARLGELSISGSSAISASGFETSDAGSVDVSADVLRLTTGGRIRANGAREGMNGEPGGSGGDIVVRVRDALFDGTVENDPDGDGFNARTGLDASNSAARAGSIRVFADTLRVIGGARIMAVGFESIGGDIEVDAGRLLLSSAGQINTGSTDGPGGSIQITARDLVEISNQGGGRFSIARALEEGMGGAPVDFGGVFALSGGPGVAGTRGGDISITAPEIRIVDGGFVATATFGATKAADIRLAGERVLILGGGGLDSSTGGSAQAGSVAVTASERISIAGQNGQMFPSRIRSITVSSGAAGDIVLRAPTIEIDGGAVATTALQAADGAAPGDAGNIQIDTDTLSLSSGGRIDSSSFSAATGGRVDIRASERLEIRGKDSGISARAASDGDGGSIHVSVPELSLSEGASISSESSEGLGASEPLVRDAAEANLFVAPTGTPSGAAGSIALDVSTARLASGSRISTLATQGTDPGAPTEGNIDIRASSDVELSGESEITASVVDGRGGDIRIATQGTAILRDDSRVVARAEGGDPARFRQGGRIDIAARVFLQEAGSQVSADAGQGVSGTVSINAPEVDLESELTRLPLGFLDAAALFKPRCAAAAERADASSFALAAQAAPPPSPEEWLVALEADADARSRALPDVAASKRAVERAEATDSGQLAVALGRLGNAFVEVEDPQRAEPYLTRALALARAQAAEPTVAALLNDLGNARAARGAHADALALYLESAEHARGTAALRARASAARAALASGDLARAAALAEPIDAAEPRTEPASREESAVLIHLGVTQRSLAQRLPERSGEFLLRANRAFERAAEQSAARSDFAAASYALGNRGALYEREHRADEALELTRQALAAAERDGSPYAQYRWHAQLGRLLWAQGRANDALNAHRRAVQMLRESRHELAYLYGRSSAKFGDSIGPVYGELVQALLAASSLVADPAQAQALLLEARDAVEQLKAAELRDYFRDECLAELESRSLPLDAVSPRSAVVYPIVLPDRLEILLTLASGVKRYTVPVSSEALAAETLRFRKQLEAYATSRYLDPSWKLYDWLVRPYADALAQADVQTLVFVTGGPLRTIPLGALHDRKKFLLESYAVAVTPSLALTDPRPLELSGRKLLLAGISEPVQGFSALPSVDAELRAIESIYGGTVLLDKSFTSAALREKLADVEFSAVHLASHARFTGGIDGSFLLAYDGPVSIQTLSDSVRATRFRDRPLELLVMSACETAAGDEQAALGLAGVAIKSGARSAVGSLWNLNDRSATELMSGFYRALGTPGVSKAEALRRAQLALIRKGAHPYFWSPFLVIGNWL